MTPTTSPSPASCCAAPTSPSRTSSPAASPSSASTTSAPLELNPRLIYLSITGFGTAEGAWLPGYDLVVQAVSGLMSLTGDPDGPAYRSGISVFDVVTGLHGTIGVLAALRQRAETGRGQHVEVNLLSSALSGLVNQTAAYTAGGVVPQRMGNAHPSVYPYQPMPTKDRDVIITAANDRQFRALCEVLDIPEVADDERFRLNADRTANRDELHPILVERLAEWSADDLFIALNKAGVPCGPINSITRRDRARRTARPRAAHHRRRSGAGGRSRAQPDPAQRRRHRVPLPAADARRAQRRDPPVAGIADDMSEPAGRADHHRGQPSFRTGIGASDADHILLLGHDLAGELIGRITFGELAYWLITKRRPTPQQRTLFEAVLVALADHGFTPTAIAARVTLLSAPESVQGALAAGLLGGGSRFLGVTEDTARYLDDVIAALDESPADEAGWDAVAVEAVSATKAQGRFVPGLGHPVHKQGDPRTPVLFDLARANDCFGPHLELFAAIGRTHAGVLGKTLPLNGAGVCGAVLADIAVPLSVVRGVALLARCAGLLGHLAEEVGRPDRQRHLHERRPQRRVSAVTRSPAAQAGLATPSQALRSLASMGTFGTRTRVGERCERIPALSAHQSGRARLHRAALLREQATVTQQATGLTDR